MVRSSNRVDLPSPRGFFICGRRSFPRFIGPLLEDWLGWANRIGRAQANSKADAADATAAKKPHLTAASQERALDLVCDPLHGYWAAGSDSGDENASGSMEILAFAICRAFGCQQSQMCELRLLGDRVVCHM